MSAGIRAFFVGGGKARYDGVDPITGEKRFRSVSHTEDVVYNKWERSMGSMKGTSLQFKLGPTITALCPAFSTQQQDLDSRIGITSLNSINLLDTLASDFARALKDLSLILADLRRLSAFGDLPISLLTTDYGPILSVRFPGCDADLVYSLCDEVGVRRGVVVEDDAWGSMAEGGEKDVEMALLFPFAPSTSPLIVSEDNDGAYYFDENPVQQEKLEWRGMLSPSTHGDLLHDNNSFEDIAMTLKSPMIHPDSPSGYESLRDSDFASDDPYYQMPTLQAPTHQGYEGVEGIYKFLQVCEDSRR